jgi:hypothetical protein
VLPAVPSAFNPFSPPPYSKFSQTHQAMEEKQHSNYFLFFRISRIKVSTEQVEK